MTRTMCAGASEAEPAAIAVATLAPLVSIWPATRLSCMQPDLEAGVASLT